MFQELSQVFVLYRSPIVLFFFLVGIEFVCIGIEIFIFLCKLGRDTFL